jgi:hypothetical protein
MQSSERESNGAAIPPPDGGADDQAGEGEQAPTELDVTLGGMPPSEESGESEASAAPAVEVVDLPLTAIPQDHIVTQRRLDPETVASYAQDMDQGDTFPPVAVFRDEAGEHWLADGGHRWAACGSGVVERTTCRAAVRRGSKRDAILYATGANAKQGLRRTNAQKHQAVETLLRDTEWVKWTNTRIAKHCAVDDKTVHNIREKLVKAEIIQPVTERETSTGQQMNITGITEGRKPTGQPNGQTPSSESPTDGAVGQGGEHTEEKPEEPKPGEQQPQQPEAKEEPPKEERPPLTPEQKAAHEAEARAEKTFGWLRGRPDGLGTPEGINAVLAAIPAVVSNHREDIIKAKLAPSDVEGFIFACTGAKRFSEEFRAAAWPEGLPEESKKSTESKPTATPKAKLAAKPAAPPTKPVNLLEKVLDALKRHPSWGDKPDEVVAQLVGGVTHQTVNRARKQLQKERAAALGKGKEKVQEKVQT